MFRDDNDAARARADALEQQKKELQEELKSKELRVQEQEELLQVQAQQLQAQQQLLAQHNLSLPLQPKPKANNTVLIFAAVLGSVLALAAIILVVLASPGSSPIQPRPESSFSSNNNTAKIPSPPEYKNNQDELDDLLGIQKDSNTPTNADKRRDELDDLLGGKKDDSPEQLSSPQINSVMSKANTSSCTAIGIGKVKVNVTINSSGAVTAATGDGTPLGNCVASIVRRLKFPSIASPSQTFSYPVYVK